MANPKSASSILRQRVEVRNIWREEYLEIEPELSFLHYRLDKIEMAITI